MFCEFGHWPTTSGTAQARAYERTGGRRRDCTNDREIALI
jgi:hypothetical protein